MLTSADAHHAFNIFIEVSDLTLNRIEINLKPNKYCKKSNTYNLLINLTNN